MAGGRCWELNLVLLEDQQVLLHTESSLQPRGDFKKLFQILLKEFKYFYHALLEVGSQLSRHFWWGGNCGCRYIHSLCLAIYHHKCPSVSRDQKFSMETPDHTSLEKFKFSWRALLNISPKFSISTIGVQQHHLKAAPPWLLHPQLWGTQPKHLAQGSCVVPIDVSGPDVHSDHGHAY